MRRFISGLARAAKSKDHAKAKGRMPHRLFLPPDLGKNGSVPLLVALHGCLQTPDDFARGTRLDEIGAKYGAIVVYPEQRERANRSRCWNWFQTKHQLRRSGEPAHILRLIEDLARQYPVDRDRIYVAGLSAGGSMAAILGEQAPDIFAGVGIMSGVALHSSKNLITGFAAMAGKRSEADRAAHVARRVAAGAAQLPAWAYGRMRVAIWTGTSDTTVAPSNAATLARQYANLLGLEHSSEERDVAPDGRSEIETWRDETGRARIQLVRVAGMDHAWSGGSPEGSFTDPAGPDASTALFEFFSAREDHARPLSGRRGGIARS
jgi:poly(hydroxyalkanoate) depolymerase family esterase